MNQPTDYEFSSPSNWIPIGDESRPHPVGETPHLIYLPEKKLVLSVTYDAATEDWWLFGVEYSVVLDCGFGNPSHWMPIPKLPEV